MDPPPSLPANQLFSLAGQNVLITGATRGWSLSLGIQPPFFFSSVHESRFHFVPDALLVHYHPLLRIGAACAIALAEAGASICLVQRPGSTNLQTFKTISELGVTVNIVECDISDHDAVRTLFERALNVMGGEIHVLVNCAGIQRRSPATEFSEKDWDDVLDVNLKSCWLLSQAAGRHMVPLRRGKIINFCSLLTFQGGFTVPAYAAAKGALGQLTKALSNEWSKDNVQVNGIVPGYIATDISSSGSVPSVPRTIFLTDVSIARNEKLLADPVRLRQISERIPAGRWGQPQDFAGPIVFLASKASQYVCGELLVVDGIEELVLTEATL
ncbi:hypothetical protein NLI96_g788 [Meripilus lineatus]|uniref:NAD(P)-binding protein n=1 Tax=Meripilus lineatus TaxID=2056292 RepID=A0AAD5VFX6_9APHY|nr:hypothetical protein NLI96_g788 [Physisporinus lineatus]